MSTLFRRARLVGRDDTPVDVLVEDDVVSAIAPSIAAGSAEVVEADGRYLAPGLWDNHVHMTQWALDRQRLDVSQATSAQEAADTVGARLRRGLAGDRDLLVASGFRDALWPDEPTSGLLDAVSGPVPVAVVSADLHSVWLNSAALARGGLAGHPTGLLREAEAFDATAAVTRVDDGGMDALIADAATAAAARGVVGIVDLEMTLGLDAWVRRVGSGVDSLRVRAGVYPDRLDEVIARRLRTGDPVPGGEGLVTMGPFKVITDGSLGTRTAYCHDPYPGSAGEPEAFGLSTYDVDSLTALLVRASAAGLVPAVHAIGDHALDDALTAFERAGCPGSIEHAQLITPAALPRFARLGLVASVQPEHAMDDRDIADHFWAGRTERAFALLDLHAAGVPLRLGSDAPVAPLDPWVSLAAALSRSRDGREPWHPEQRLPAAVGLAASTDGRLAVTEGDVADLVLVERDPLTATGDELREFAVSATMLGGRFTFRQP
ncbi:N-substituted formamide deformylase [Frondihabitans sp. 762G35]|uniref:amidohydrolase n=1 Tax=Frondihabitans sp. 762G35 TaxID=1446794 RepID=UPI000D205ABB|nr:amidohydrolase family protein [Frondihabitans sp. 762G35]ARC56444.1 N-substituted formamide deformylase [Frondihabitans sp. 762G35]